MALYLLAIFFVAMSGLEFLERVPVVQGAPRQSTAICFRDICNVAM